MCCHVMLGVFQDWHLGGKCDVFLWGAGRHGQLAEAGRNILVPTTAPSFSQAQQVHHVFVTHITSSYITVKDVSGKAVGMLMQLLDWIASHFAHTFMVSSDIYPSVPSRLAFSENSEIFWILP